jgi:predicted RNase H-like HicB family nuclease
MAEPQRVASYEQYLREAMRRAEYEQLDAGGWYARIPGFQGLWATGPTIEDTRNDLWEALDGWLFVNGFVSHLPPPHIEGVEFDVAKRRE